MDLFEALRGRRSVRKYADAPVEDGDLEAILEAGRISASWANTQCWEVVVVRDPSAKEALRDTLSETNPARRAMVQAPVVLVACGRKERAGFKGGAPTTALGDWLMFDVALFLSNVTHAAHALGYGTVHVGLFDHDKAGEIVGVPSDVQVVELVPIGRPEGPPRNTPPRRPVEEFRHDERF